jgi:hypothetical protein
MSSRRFPPPWSVEETDACFIVRDANGQALAYVYFEANLFIDRIKGVNENRSFAHPPTARMRLKPSPTQREEIMAHLILPGDNTTYPPEFSLLGESSLAITMDEIGIGDFVAVDALTLSGTTSVSIATTGAANGQNFIHQLIETTNNLTTVTIGGAEEFFLEGKFGQSNSEDGVVTDIAAKAASPTTIHSLLTLIDASATRGGVQIEAGATNTSSDGQFLNFASLNANVTITYTGLTIIGGSGTDGIENDAKNGIVTDGTANNDVVILGGAGAKAKLGTGSAIRFPSG